MTVNPGDDTISFAGRYQIIYYSYNQFAIDPNETSNNMELGTFTFHQPTYPQSIQVSIIDPTPLTLSYPSTLPPYHTDISNTVVHWFLTDFSASPLSTNRPTDRSFMYNVVDISNNRSYLGRINFSDTSAELYFDGKYKDSVNIIDDLTLESTERILDQLKDEKKQREKFELFKSYDANKIFFECLDSLNDM